MTHDKFCMMYKDAESLDELYDCDCSFIEDIRADEREKVEAPIRALIADSKHCELPFYDIDHDGGECCIRMNKVRKVLDGEWTVEDHTIDKEWKDIVDLTHKYQSFTQDYLDASREERL